MLEGSVRRDGPRLRVAAQLVKATDGLALWSETYERELKDVFQVQEDIARSIASALRLTLGAESEAHLIAGTPRSLEAHDLYLRGRFYFNKYTEVDLRRSFALYQQALARDSTYAPAWAGIADAWGNLADDYLPPREAYPKARAAAQRAIALDPALAEAHASLGLILSSYDWDFAAAEREFQRAIALNPNAATAYHYYGEFLLGSPGRLDSALVVLRRAQSLDPLSAWTLEDVGWVFEIMGRYSEAIEQNRQALELDPHAWRALYFMARALLLAERPDEALRTLGRAEDPPGTVTSHGRPRPGRLGQTRRGSARASRPRTGGRATLCPARSNRGSLRRAGRARRSLQVARAGVPHAVRRRDNSRRGAPLGSNSFRSTLRGAGEEVRDTLKCGASCVESPTSQKPPYWGRCRAAWPPRYSG